MLEFASKIFQKVDLQLSSEMTPVCRGGIDIQGLYLKIIFKRGYAM